MGGNVRQIKPLPLTREEWEPFGWLPVADTDPSDGAETLEFAWADPHLNVIGHRRDEVPAAAGGLRCEMLYRHATHTQALMPLDVSAVIVVAPPGLEIASSEDVERARAFVLEPLSSIVLYRATWHWGPFPVDAESVSLFNVQGLRYVEDNEMADLAAIGAAVDVLVG
jgi:ureidoglycolate hydrolase